MRTSVDHIYCQSVRRFFLSAVLSVLSATALAQSGAVEYWGGAKSLTDMAAFVQAFLNITLELVNVIATLVAFYSCATIYIKIQSGEEGFTKQVAMLIGAIVYFVTMLIVFPSFFTGGGSGHGGFFDLIFG